MAGSGASADHRTRDDQMGAGHQFGVEFVCLPEETRQRLNSRLRTELIHLLKTRSGQNELLVLPVQKH